MKNSITTRLILLLIAITSTVTILSGFYLVNYQIKDIRKNTDHIGDIIAKNIADACEWSVLSSDTETIKQTLQKITSQEPELIYARIDFQQNNTIEIGTPNKNNTKAYSAPIETIVLSDNIQQITDKLNNEKTPQNSTLIGTVTIYLSMDNLMHKVKRLQLDALSILLPLLLIAAVIIITTIRLIITRPIMPLLKGVNSIASGNFDIHIPIRSDNEISRLANAFNLMAQNLADTHVSRDYLNNIIQLMFNGLIIVDKDGIITLCNNTICDMLEYTNTEIIGKSIEKIVNPNSFAIDSMHEIRNISAECLTKNGHSINVLFSASEINNTQLNKKEWICVFQDISALKTAEKKLKAFTHELERSNHELEQVAYVISHDLKEPLRMVSSYVTLLKKRYENKLDEDANDFIHYAMDGALRMQDLIDALLSYARVGTTATATKNNIDCNEMLATVIQNLSIAIKEKNASIKYNVLPTIISDKVMLTQIIQNLIANGIKFNKSPQPIIEISISEKDNEWLFSVQDNGIGIDARHMERIFIMFKRLHSREEYPGTGIGLALCKKIIENLGGTIWVESKPEQGSSFYFTIPKKGGNYEQ